MTTPAERIRRVLNFAATLFPQSEAQDALAALAEMEAERDALRAKLAVRDARISQLEKACTIFEQNSLHCADEFEAKLAAIRRAEKAEAQLAEIQAAPTVAWLATQQQRNPSQCVVTTKLDGWDHVELIARPQIEVAK